MYRVYVNGELFGMNNSETVEYLLSTPKVRVEPNKSGSFECIIYPGHKFYDRLIKMKSYVEVFQEKDRIFSGRLLRTELNSSRELSCYFEGSMSYLLDSVQKPGKYEEETLASYFKRLLDEHNAQVDVEKRFEPGVVTLDEAYETVTFESTSYADTFSAIQSDLINQYGGYLWIRDFGGKRYLDYVKDYNRQSPQELYFGDNAIDITENISGEDIFTVLLPLGPSQSVTENVDEEHVETTTTIMTIETVNNGSIYLEDQELVDRYGWIVKPQSFNDAEDPSDLLNKAKEYLEKQPLGLATTFEVKAIDLNLLNPEVRQIHLGDLVPVVSRPHKIRKLLPCISIEYDLNQPWETVYEIGEIRKDLSSKYTTSVSTINDAIQGQNYVINQTNSVINKQGQDIIVNARDIAINARNIDINAENITANAERIELNAKQIELNAEEIRLKASQTQVDEIHNRTTELEAEIVVQAGEIALRARKTELDAVDQKHTGEEERLFTRIADAEIRIGNGEINMNTLSANLYGEIGRIDRTYDALSKEVDEVGESVTQAFIKIDANTASIQLKADSTVMDEVSRRVTSAEINVDALKGEISLKASQESVAGLMTRVSNAEINIDASKAAISLKADSTTVSSLGERVTSAEIDINGLRGQITLKADVTTVTGIETSVTAKLDAANAKLDLKVDRAGVIAAINASVEESEGSKVVISADKINLKGYVTASRVDAVEATINNLTSGTTEAAVIKTINLYCSGYFYYKSKSYTANKITYLDASNVSHTITVLGTF